MRSRLLFAIGTTAVLLGGVFVLRTAAPAEPVEAISSDEARALERQTGSVSVVTEMVTAQTVTSPRIRAAASHSGARGRLAPAQKRSLLARVFLGDGEPRPQPFPRPARTVSARP